MLWISVSRECRTCIRMPQEEEFARVLQGDYRRVYHALLGISDICHVWLLDVRHQSEGRSITVV